MSDWTLPPIPSGEIPIEEFVEDKMARPGDYERAEAWIREAVDLRINGKPLEALVLLQQVVDLCPHEITAWVLIGDVYGELGDLDLAGHAYRIGAAYGDVAAKERLHRLGAQDVKNLVQGLIAEGTPEAIRRIRETLLGSEATTLHWAEYRDIAKGIGRLKAKGAGDLAWALLNRSLNEAASAGVPLYTIYTEQGHQLYRERKYDKAMQDYLLAFLHAPQPSPKYIRRNLQKCFERVDKSDDVSLGKFLELARSKGWSSRGLTSGKGIEIAMRYLLEGEDQEAKTKQVEEKAGKRKGILARLLRK